LDYIKAYLARPFFSINTLDLRVFSRMVDRVATAILNFFTYSSANHADLCVPRYMPEVGQRRTYFLKRHDGVYRSVGDVTDYNVPVQSGTHIKSFCDGKSPGCCIAEIILTPAPDTDANWFVHDLGGSVYAAGTLCSPRKAQELLSQLTQNPDAPIANAAIGLMTVLE